MPYPFYYPPQQYQPTVTMPSILLADPKMRSMIQNEMMGM